MTNMKVNKEIEQMQKTICNRCSYDKIENYPCKKEPSSCGSYLISKIFYEAGYRKIDDYEKLKVENERLLNCVEKNFTFETTAGNKYSIFNTVRKEFAEECKNRINADYVDGKLNNHKGYLTENDIQELLKGYEKWEK